MDLKSDLTRIIMTSIIKSLPELIQIRSYLPNGNAYDQEVCGKEDYEIHSEVKIIFDDLHLSEKVLQLLSSFLYF